MKQSVLDPLGLQNISRILKADKAGRIPQYFKERTDSACVENGKNITTIHQHIMGGESIFTVEPRNIQAVLATQFKDFGLGKVRNRNFSPLLGHGIVSSMTLVLVVEARL